MIHPPDDLTENELGSVSKLKNKLDLPLSEAIKDSENREKVAKQIEGYHLKVASLHVGETL